MVAALTRRPMALTFWTISLSASFTYLPKKTVFMCSQTCSGVETSDHSPSLLKYLTGLTTFSYTTLFTKSRAGINLPAKSGTSSVKSPSASTGQTLAPPF